MVNGLVIMQFWSTAEISALGRFGQSEQFGLMTRKPIQSQETSNYSIVDNFLSF
jgi:hypothetical protein